MVQREIHVGASKLLSIWPQLKHRNYLVRAYRKRLSYSISRSIVILTPMLLVGLSASFTPPCGNGPLPSMTLFFPSLTSLHSGSALGRMPSRVYVGGRSEGVAMTPAPERADKTWVLREEVLVCEAADVPRKEPPSVREPRTARMIRRVMEVVRTAAML